MKTLIFAALILSSVCALATSGSAGNLGCDKDCFDTPYSQLEVLYGQGTVPDSESLVGWFSGRCYYADDKSKPVNNLLVGWNEYVEDSPLSPGSKTIFKAILLKRSDKPAHYYDILTSEMEASVYGAVSEYGPYVIESSISDDALLATYYREGYGYPRKQFFRRYGKYTIAKIVIQDIGDIYCYASKKIK